MERDLEKLGESALAEIQAAADTKTLEEIRISVLGKKGSLSNILKGLSTLSKEDRPRIGALSNEWKSKIESCLDERRTALEGAELNERLAKEWIDITLPAREAHRGTLHPITQTTRKIVGILGRLGFDVRTGPEVETEYLNFDSLNFPPNHPARDMQDTFFIGPQVILRTHTSPVQMREMLSRKPPIRILCPGTVYRADHDATHSPMFHQIEGLWIDQNVSFADLKGVMEYFMKELFGSSAKVRFRPSFFPFTEPSAELDVSSPHFKTEWLEVAGAGMVHPNLFKEAGYAAGEFTGFAFGLGIERMAMLLHGITDLRVMYGGDVRFLNQF